MIYYLFSQESIFAAKQTLVCKRNSKQLISLFVLKHFKDIILSSPSNS